MTKAALKSSSAPLPVQHGTDKTAAQLVVEQAKAGIAPGPKDTPLQLDHMTKLDSAAALDLYSNTAIKVANNAKEMICAGVVCYMIGRHFARGMKPTLGQVRALLVGRLTTTSANKGMGTLQNWITVSQDIYLRMTSPDEKNYGGVVNDIRTAQSVEHAADVCYRYLSKQVIAGGDGKEYSATDSIDLMKAWSVWTPNSKPKEKTRGEQQNTAGKTISRAIEDMVDNTKATSEEVAKIVINNVAAGKASPLDLVNAALARVGENVKQIEALCLQQFTILVSKDREQARKTLADMTAYLASADKAASEAPLKPDPKASPTATDDNTELAAASNTAAKIISDLKPTEASDQPSKPASKAKGKRAA